jgi:hypothetical protein
MEKVFIVTEGSYSDYGIESVHTTKESAEEWIENANHIYVLKHYKIEEWDLNPSLLIDNKKPYVINMYADGELLNKKFGAYIRNYEEGLIAFALMGERQNELHGEFHVRADNEEHAIKIANEKRLQVIAADRWNKGIIKGI